MLRTISHLRSPVSLKSQLMPSFSPPLSSYFSHTPFLLRQQKQDDDEFNRDPEGPPRLLVVQPRLRPETFLKAKLDEALNLANSLEEQRDGFYQTEFLEKQKPSYVVVQNPMVRGPRADTFFGPGTVDNIKCNINASESEGGVDAIFVNAILSGIQQRNLERAWGKPVLDRLGLIIEIFNAHAQTKEAKLQAELAALMYKRSTLVRVRGNDGRYTFGAIGSVGEAEVVSARGRGSGGRGFISGAGESELHLQRRRILERRNQLLAEIKEVRRMRALQRSARKRHGGSGGQDIAATVAVVGYTNAGKSTLVSALSRSYMYCDDRLFATVDPKLSRVILPSGRKVLLSDTVGFISELPVQLVEAFHATLEEVVEADLLVHVLDSSAPDLDEQREAVLGVLKQIGVSEEKLENMIEVWNKIDLQEKEFDYGEIIDEDYASNLSSAEEVCQNDDNEDLKAELSRDLGDHNHNHHGDFSDGWLSNGNELDTWVDYDGPSVGGEGIDSQQKGLVWNWRRRAVESRSESETNGPVKTSAITGVGLQELLELIDERLPSQRVVERSIFDRKWRPSEMKDDAIPLEQ